LGWTTGRETQRGPKPAREQAFSREKRPICQTKGAAFAGQNRLFDQFMRVWVPRRAATNSKGAQQHSLTVAQMLIAATPDFASLHPSYLLLLDQIFKGNGRARIGGDPMTFDAITSIVIPSASGAFIALSERYIRGRPIPTFLTKPVQRGDPFALFLLASAVNMMFGIIIAHFIFDADNSRQYFLASAAAVAILQSHTDLSTTEAR
jgi:hypothetical protein